MTNDLKDCSGLLLYYLKTFSVSSKGEDNLIRAQSVQGIRQPKAAEFLISGNNLVMCIFAIADRPSTLHC